MADVQKLLSRKIPMDKLAKSLKQKYGKAPKMTVRDRKGKKKKGEKDKFVDGSVRLEMAEREELEEVLSGASKGRAVSVVAHRPAADPF
jgi:hypothetical protein